MTAAADSGLLLAEKLNRVPDYIVGDMDSLPDPAILDKYPTDRVLRYPRKKDFTDTELGIDLLREKGCDKIIILGGGGGRLDHLLAIFSLFHRASPPDVWLTDREEVTLIRSVFTLNGWRGRELSLMPMGREPARMSSRGLRWPLDELVWDAGDFGISNVVEDDTAEIVVGSGRLLAIRSWRPQ